MTDTQRIIEQLDIAAIRSLCAENSNLRAKLERAIDGLSKIADDDPESYAASIARATLEELK